MTRWKKTCVALMLSVVCVMSTGCPSDDNVIQGIHMPRAVEPSTARSRIEAELIPNAQRVREDTTPRWQLGRYAFKKGADKLLVVSRITSFETKPSYSQKKRGILPTRVDQILERVWITLPLGTQLKEELKIEDLEDRFHVGYDEGEIGGEMWVQPNRVLGKLMLIKDRPDMVEVLVDMRVEPKRLPSWSVKGVLKVPVVQEGVRATPVEEDLWDKYKKLHEEEAAAASADPAEADSVSDVPSEPMVIQTPPPPAPVAINEAAPAKGPRDEGDQAQQRTIVGRWAGRTPNATTSEWRFQFDVDGTFVFTSRREQHPPAVRYGTYEIKKNTVIMHIKKFLVRGIDHYRHIEDNPFMSLRISWGGPVLQLYGDLGLTVDEIQLLPASYPDMNIVTPYSNE